MKFGKRLAQEAARKYQENYFDYKKLKAAIKDDVLEHDVQGTHFQRVLVSELQKVSASYSAKAAELEATYKVCVANSCLPELAELRSEVQELIKFVALNYLAVVKAIKKRNRHLKENFGTAANTSLHALDLLIGEVFFTSPRLASLATQAEVLARDLQGGQDRNNSSSGGADAAAGGSTGSSDSGSGTMTAAATAQQQKEQKEQQQQQLLEEYSCPVCLETLHNPVVLTCAHRFCWGCLVAHCTSCRDTTLPGTSLDKVTPAPAATYRVLEDIACVSEPEAPTFYPCPVCRKPQILDIDTLQVDTYLEQFVTNLQNISTMTTVTTTPPAQTTTTMPQPPKHALPESGVASPTHLVLRKGKAPKQEPWGIIPPQSPEHKGKLCVLLDLDGTLVSSFTPRRAPRLPPYVRTHVVGVGSKLNPQGVFVVERPGLTAFLEQLAVFAEVIIYTAGLEDYASPIIDAIDPTRRLFTSRIYREGTLRTEHYQCVKDMARLNRDLSRTVLVDDTPLAFLHQPDNGVPVLGFRGDPDDRLLLEAVLPLLQVLADEPDVTSVLQRRFDMAGWFRRHGFPVEMITRRALADAAEERARHAAKGFGQDSSSKPSSRSSLEGLAAAYDLQPTCLLPPIAPPTHPSKDFLLLTDFDLTLTDWDAGERLAEQLAPELLPMLVGVECPTSCVPITNSVLSEMQRRGVSRDRLLATLHELGAQELPQASVKMLQALRAAQIDVKVLSDCNSVFIIHILAGARVAGLVQDIITNPATFECTPTAAPAAPASPAAAPAAAPHAPPSPTAASFTSSLTASLSASLTTLSTKLAGHPPSPTAAAAAQPSSPTARAAAAQQHPSSPAAARVASTPVPPVTAPLGHRLVVTPWHGAAGRPAHTCSMCPGNMCKGREVRALRQAGTYRRIIFAGDGQNDICGALCLGPQDVVLARVGRPLADYIARAGKGEEGTVPLQAAHQLWSTHEQLQRMVANLTVAPPRRK